MMANEPFAKWATGFSGCDGGNLQGPIWICGIEYGGGDTERDLKFDDQSTPAWVGRDPSAREDFLKFPYNRKAIKLLAAIAGEPAYSYQSFFKERNVFGQHSAYFKLNLYPLGFKDHSPSRWADWLVSKTGLSSEAEYWRWCREHRFPRLRELVVEYVPRLIVCTGITEDGEFRDAFIGTDRSLLSTTSADKEIKYQWSNDGETLLVIVHFLGGPHGLNSDDEIAHTGARIAELLSQRRKAAADAKDNS